MDNIGERHTVILYSVCMFGQHFQQSVGQPGIVASPARGQLNRKNEFPCPCSRLRIWSPETQVRPSRPASPRSFSTLRLNHQSSIINHQSSIIKAESSIINHQSSIINHQSSIINHQSSIINHQSSIWCLIAGFLPLSATTASTYIYGQPPSDQSRVYRVTCVPMAFNAGSPPAKGQ